MPRSKNSFTNRDVILSFLAKLLQVRGDGRFSICDLEARVPEYARSHYAHAVACGTVRRTLFLMIERGELGRVEAERPDGKRHKVYTHHLTLGEILNRIGGTDDV